MLKHDKLLAIVFLFFMGCIVGCTTKQENTARKQLFDFNWKFHLGDISSANALEFNDKQWRDLDLPHDWSIDAKLNQKNPMEGVGWYRKKFDIPSDWKSKSVSVYFEGVYKNAEVFINGTSLGVNPKGKTSFYYNLTPYLNYKKENNIAVRVNNSEQMDNAWHSESGIYRHVWLIVTDPIHFGH